MFCCISLAKNNSNPAFKRAKHRLSQQYQLDKKHCALLAGQASKLCKVQALGSFKIAVAALHEVLQPSKVAHYHSHLIQAQADYAWAKQQCDVSSDRRRCVIFAKADNRAAVAEAKWVLSKISAHFVASKQQHFGQSNTAKRAIEIYY